MYKKILIPVDGSQPSDKAVEHGVALAEKLGAQVVIFNVVQPVSYHVPQGFVYTDMLSEKIMDWGLQILDEYKKRFQTEKIAIKTDIATGMPADVICEKAEKEKFDLVVIGSQGLSASLRILLGSVSDRVSRRCPCPVLIVR
jgi:nucleotide-binding universal stress UspA family protein